MAKSFQLKILTAEKKVFEESVESLTVPAWEGRMGILPGHARQILLLRPGPLRLRGAQGEKTFVLKGGLMHITPQEAKILTPAVLTAEEENLH